MPFHLVIGVAIFLVVYVAISIELVNKTVAALAGAALFMIFHIVGEERAFGFVDWNVIFLLFGMMVIVGITKQSGVFQFVAIRMAKVARGRPLRIMLLLSLITALFSSLLDNVTTILIVSPVTIMIAVELEISPVPLLISEAIASNVGGTATLVGDPPNIMIGSAAHFTFIDFLTNIAPFVIILMILDLALLALFFRKQLKADEVRRMLIMEMDEKKSIEDRPLMIKSLSVIVLVIIGFLLQSQTGLEAGAVALGGAALLMLLTGGKEIDRYFADIEWGSIFFFIGLFILVGGLVLLGVVNDVAQFLLGLTKDNMEVTSAVLIWASGLLSAIVDNIPYVATMIPLVEHFGKVLGETTIEPLWWALSLGACLGGNGTLVGASANVIAAGIAKRSGFHISFLEFTKYGALITLFNLILSTVFIDLFYF
ncbi:MAG TPA: ArsB/NhaD family transporter [Spirochaetia bacterium]|nr:ArsB/NhaD family transporter [Spirochaetia bacterium]